MIVAALPLVGGVLDGKTSGVFAKQLCENSRDVRSCRLLRHDVRSAGSLHSNSPARRGVKGWAQSWILLVRDKIGSIRLHRGQSNIACLADSRLTLSQCGGDAL